jgi:hypothetical protein
VPALTALHVTEARLHGPLAEDDRADGLLLLSQLTPEVHEGRRVDARRVHPELTSALDAARAALLVTASRHGGVLDAVDPALEVGDEESRGWRAARSRRGGRIERGGLIAGCCPTSPPRPLGQSRTDRCA